MVELDALGHLVAGDAGGEEQRHVDARRHAGGGDHLALLDHPLERRPGAVLLEVVEGGPVARWRRGPSRSPAAPRSSEPVHTDVVNVVVGWTASIHGTIGSPYLAMRRVMVPPGIDHDVGAR